MCKRILLKLIEIDFFSFLNIMTTKQHNKLRTVLLFFLVFSLLFMQEIYHATGILKKIIILFFIIYLIIGFLNGIKILMNNKGDLENVFFSLSYCIQLFISVIGILFLVFFWLPHCTW